MVGGEAGVESFVREPCLLDDEVSVFPGQNVFGVARDGEARQALHRLPLQPPVQSLFQSHSARLGP